METNYSQSEADGRENFRVGRQSRLRAGLLCREEQRAKHAVRAVRPVDSVWQADGQAKAQWAAPLIPRVRQAVIHSTA